jgi:hypothetical protein
MAHFAKIEDNIVQQVIVIDNETLGNLEFPDSEVVGQEFIASLGLDGTWKQTSYNGSFRFNYAGPGYNYDEIRDAFIPSQPFKSWLLNEDTCQWYPPSPMPEVEDISNGDYYFWNEGLLVWELRHSSL